jgi:hypothetical protein
VAAGVVSHSQLLAAHVQRRQALALQRIAETVTVLLIGEPELGLVPRTIGTDDHSAVVASESRSHLLGTGAEVHRRPLGAITDVELHESGSTVTHLHTRAQLRRRSSLTRPERRTLSHR